MVIQIFSSAQKLSSWGSPHADLFESPGDLYSTDCSVFALSMLKTGSLLCFYVFIRGKHPVCGEPLFCLSANPDSLSKLCGFHIDHRSRSFLLQVSGISSLLSFCCTSLVSGFIIQEDAQFVYSQSAQQIRHTFASKVQISGIHEFRLSGALLHLPWQRLCPADRAGPSQTLLRHIK